MPQLITGSMLSFEIRMVSEVEAQTRASSSAMIAWVTMSAPAPPYSTGMPRDGKLELDAGVEGLLGIGGLPVRLGGVGRDPVLGELAEGVPELPVGLGQGEIGRIHPHKLLSGAVPTLAGPGRSPGAFSAESGRFTGYSR